MKDNDTRITYLSDNYFYGGMMYVNDKTSEKKYKTSGEFNSFLYDNIPQWEEPYVESQYITACSISTYNNITLIKIIYDKGLQGNYLSSFEYGSITVSVDSSGNFIKAIEEINDLSHRSLVYSYSEYSALILPSDVDSYENQNNDAFALRDKLIRLLENNNAYYHINYYEKYGTAYVNSAVKTITIKYEGEEDIIMTLDDFYDNMMFDGISIFKNFDENRIINSNYIEEIEQTYSELLIQQNTLQSNLHLEYFLGYTYGEHLEKFGTVRLYNHEGYYFNMSLYVPSL